MLCSKKKLVSVQYFAVPFPCFFVLFTLVLLLLGTWGWCTATKQNKTSWWGKSLKTCFLCILSTSGWVYASFLLYILLYIYYFYFYILYIITIYYTIYYFYFLLYYSQTLINELCWNLNSCMFKIMWCLFLVHFLLAFNDNNNIRIIHFNVCKLFYVWYEWYNITVYCEIILRPVCISIFPWMNANNNFSLILSCNCTNNCVYIFCELNLSRL